MVNTESMARSRRAFVLAALGVATLTAGSATAATRSVVEFKIPTAKSGPTEMTVGPDGNVWFVDQTTGKIGTVTHKGGITGFLIPTAKSQPAGIASGPDGGLWFTEAGTNKIGRYMPGSGFTQFTIPTAASSPRGIAAGADGDMWFTEYAANKIGRVTTSGSFTQFTLTGAASGPSRIAAGPDGNLWVTLAKTNEIAKVTTSGTITRYALPAGAAPARITAGPDGNMWFTEPGINKVANITTGGTVTQFPLPSAGEKPAGISAGADGNVWFTEQGTNRIGKITPGGTVSEFSVPTAGSVPSGITVGGDGEIWFSEFTGNKVGYVADAAGHTTYAVIHDNASEPTSRVIPLGTSMRWIFVGPSAHSVTDSTAMGLYDSHAQHQVSTFSQLFGVAGDYPYSSTVASDPTSGVIKVPPMAPLTGTQNTPFTVTWATSIPNTGTVDIQVETPGSSSFTPWVTGSSALSGAYTPTAGAGVYKFQARLNLGGGSSDWSSITRVTVS